MRTLGILCCGLLAACTATSEETAPKKNELFFPTGIAVAPNESVAFVANSNSDLANDSGAVMVLDLDRVDEVIDAWQASPSSFPQDDDDGDGENGGADCYRDPEHSETLICDESRFFLVEGGVRIGNFATDISVQDLGDGRLRLFIPTRGDPSIAWVDYDNVAQDLSCVENPRDSYPLCDSDHRLAFVRNDDENGEAVPEEPFGVYVDTAGEFAMVTHLTTGSVSLIDSPRDGVVQVSDVLTGIFGADSNGFRGATGVAGNGNGIVYVGARTEDRIQTFTVGRPANGALPYMLPGKWFFLDSVGGFAGSSNDTRGMTFSPDGKRLFLVNRRPASVQIIDTTLTPAGVPRDQIVGATDVCRQGSNVAVTGTGTEQRAYITCFQDGQLYVVDPNGGVYVEDIALVGAGPYAASAARSRNKLYVTNFLEDTIAVVDIAASSPTRNRVVLRIGIPKDL